MEASIPLLFAGVVGFSHAFEADHLVAVSNIVTKRKNFSLALKDGVYWGLGHTSTVLFVGVLMILVRATFLDGYFIYLEAMVGIMLIFLGFFRLYQFFNPSTQLKEQATHKHNHHLAYGVGLIHGLAGSGALILLITTEIKSNLLCIIYLIIFGIGSVLGMLVAAGLFTLPFSKKINAGQHFQSILILLSSLLCIGYGAHLVIEHLV